MDFVLILNLHALIPYCTCNSIRNVEILRGKPVLHYLPIFVLRGSGRYYIVIKAGLPGYGAERVREEILSELRHVSRRLDRGGSLPED